MTVQLSSLRVAPELDAGNYTAGAADKVSADKAMVTSSNAAGAAVAQTGTKVNAAGDTLSRFRRQYDEVYAAEQKFAAGLNVVNRGLETGRISIEGAQRLLVGMQNRLGMVANSEEAAAAGQIRLAAAIDAANAQIAEQASTAARDATELDRLRNSEAAAAREADRMASGVAALRAQLNPMAAAQDQVNAEIAEYVRWAERGVISAEELARAQAMARGRLSANQNKPGSNIGALGAASQFQDIAITAAMGQSIPTIALQQGTQLAGQLQMALGEQGAAGAARLLGSAVVSLVNPVSLLAIGVTAVSAAAIQWFISMRDGGPSATEVLKAHAEWLDQVLVGYEAAQKAGKRYLDEAMQLPQAAVESDLDARRKALLAEYQKQLESVKAAQTDMLRTYIDEYERSADRDPSLRQAAALQELQRALDVTNPNLDDLISRLTAVKNSDAGEMVRATASAMLDAAIKAKSLGSQIQSIDASRGGLSRATLAAQDLKEAIERIDSTSARRQLTALYTDAIEGKVSVDGVSSALIGLSGTELNLAGPIGQLQALFKAAIDAKNAVSQTQQLTPLGQISPIYSGGGGFIDEQEVMNRRADGTKSQFEIEQERSAKSAERAADELQRKQEALDRELEQLRTSLMTQEELENSSYATRMLDIQAFYEQGMIAKQEYDALLERAHIDHEDRMLEISRQRAEQDARIRDAMYSYAASTFGSLASAAESFGEKGLATAKAFGIAQALISTYAGIAKALDNPWPLNFVIAASVAAAGFAQVANIMSTRKGGGGSRSSSFGGGGSSGSTGSAAAPAQQTQALSLQIIGDVFPRQSVVDLIQQINDAQKDGHKVDIHLKGA